MENEQRNAELSQWHTPPWLAERLWQWVRGPMVRTVLEPSAGDGALLKPVFADTGFNGDVQSMDLDPRRVEQLKALTVRTTQRHHVREGDFLAREAPPKPHVDIALMNPPYEHDQDFAFVDHAFKFARRVVGVFRAAFLFGDTRHRELWQHVDVLRGARMANRPSFGLGATGDTSKYDFIALDMQRRRVPRRASEPSTEQWAWWSK